MKKAVVYTGIFLGLVYLGTLVFISFKFNTKDIIGFGQFGDFFGFLNCLFSGAAFLMLIYTALLQKEELALQRKDIEKNTAELEQQAINQRLQLAQAQKINDLNILDTLHGILGQENDNYNRRIANLSLSEMHQLNRPQIDGLNAAIQENHDKAMKISEIFNNEYTDITNRLKGQKTKSFIDSSGYVTLSNKSETEK
jgi:hypothetical protein